MRPGAFGLRADGTGELLVDASGMVVNGSWKVEYDPETDCVRCPARGDRPPSKWLARAPEGTEVPGYSLPASPQQERADD